MRNTTVPINLKDASAFQILAAAAGLIIVPFVMAINKISGPVMPRRKADL